MIPNNLEPYVYIRTIDERDSSRSRNPADQIYRASAIPRIAVVVTGELSITFTAFSPTFGVL